MDAISHSVQDRFMIITIGNTNSYRASTIAMLLRHIRYFLVFLLGFVYLDTLFEVLLSDDAIGLVS